MALHSPTNHKECFFRKRHSPREAQSGSTKSLLWQSRKPNITWFNPGPNHIEKHSEKQRRLRLKCLYVIVCMAKCLIKCNRARFAAWNWTGILKNEITKSKACIRNEWRSTRSWAWMQVLVCACQHLTNLSHLGQVQGGPMLLGIFRPPALHRGLFVVQHTGLGPAPGETPGGPGSLACPSAQFWCGVWRAGLWCLFHLVLWQADLLMGKGEGPEEGVALRVGMMGGRRDRTDWRGCELRVRRQAVEERQVQGAIRRYAGARGQTKAQASLHDGKMSTGKTPSTLDTSSTVAPSLFHCCPHPGTLGLPRWAKPTEFVREWKRAALTLAWGGCGSLAGRSGTVTRGGACVMGNGSRLHAITEAEVFYQTGDCSGAARVLGPVPARRLRHHIP